MQFAAGPREKTNAGIQPEPGEEPRRPRDNMQNAHRKLASLLSWKHSVSPEMTFNMSAHLQFNKVYFIQVTFLSMSGSTRVQSVFLFQWRGFHVWIKKNTILRYGSIALAYFLLQHRRFFFLEAKQKLQVLTQASTCPWSGTRMTASWAGYWMWCADTKKITHCVVEVDIVVCKWPQLPLHSGTSALSHWLGFWFEDVTFKKKEKTSTMRCGPKGKPRRIMWWCQGNISMQREIGSHYKVDNDFLLKTFQEFKPPDCDAKSP